MPGPLLPALFDASVVTEEVLLPGPALDELLPAEAALLPRAAAGRLLEFRGGRHCARRALARLGVSGSGVLRADDRSPVWPPGVVGSISHTRDGEHAFCGAAVARSADVRAVGLDAERDAPLGEHLFARVLTDTERSAVLALPEAERGVRGKLVFSAKEAVYKCQHPLTRTYLEFRDVRVEVVADGTFVAEILRDVPVLGRGFRLRGRWVRAEGLVVSGVAIG